MNYSHQDLITWVGTGTKLLNIPEIHVHKPILAGVGKDRSEENIFEDEYDTFRLGSDKSSISN